MDRQKSVELPKMQVGFIDAICMPIYKVIIVYGTLPQDIARSVFMEVLNLVS